jgi:serine/threonine protein kinase
LLLNSNGELVAKIADFGLSVPMYSGALQSSKARERTVANPLWLAPEILREEQYTLSSDGKNLETGGREDERRRKEGW